MQLALLIILINTWRLISHVFEVTIACILRWQRRFKFILATVRFILEVVFCFWNLVSCELLENVDHWECWKSFVSRIFLVLKVIFKWRDRALTYKVWQIDFFFQDFEVGVSQLIIVICRPLLLQSCLFSLHHFWILGGRMLQQIERLLFQVIADW